MPKKFLLILLPLVIVSQIGFASTNGTAPATKNHSKSKSVHSLHTAAKPHSTAKHPATSSHSKKIVHTTQPSKTPSATAKKASVTTKHTSTTSKHHKKSLKGRHVSKHKLAQGNPQAIAGSQSQTLSAPLPLSTQKPLPGRIVSMVDDTIKNLRYSVYKLGGTHYDAQKGVYMVDCSDYVDHLLHDASPQAYTNLAQWSGSYRPTSAHYYDFFTRYINGAPKSTSWQKVENSEKLQGGDILVLRYKSSRGRSAGGHVMVVMNEPRGYANVLQVRVADSAASGHSADTRAAHTSGIGVGTMLLKVNNSGQPYAYAWSADSPWKSNVEFAMARPLNRA